jgi:hypothetical protein
VLLVGEPVRARRARRDVIPRACFLSAEQIANPDNLLEQAVLTAPFEPTPELSALPPAGVRYYARTINYVVDASVIIEPVQAEPVVHLDRWRAKRDESGPGTA